MASALEINAEQTIRGGHGLAVSANLLSAISTFQSHEPIQSLANLLYNATNSGNVSANLLPALTGTTGIGANVANNAWIIDFYTPNVTPVTSSSIFTYAEYIVPVYDPNPAHWTTDPESGAVTKPIIRYDHIPVTSTAGFSHNVGIQANLPFGSGSATDKMVKFANVFQYSHGFSSSNFDTVSSVHLLKDKTYGQSGLGYKGPVDLMTSGIGANGDILANAVKNWGTMFDISHIASCNDVYVFGQNLLNQGFGSLGNLGQSMSDAGLNLSDLTQVPHPVKTTEYIDAVKSYSSFIGQIELPSLDVKVSTTTVSGNSADVLEQIYSSITGGNLEAIVSATGFVPYSGANLTLLSDYLKFDRVIDPTTRTQLSQNLGITDFTSFNKYLQSRIGKAYFRSWAEVAQFLSSFEVPHIPHLAAASDANTPLIPNSTVTAVNTRTGNGEGPFTNTTIIDYLGAVAGMPYTGIFNTLNENYNHVVPKTLGPAMTALDSAVNQYIIDYTAYLNSYSAGSGEGSPGGYGLTEPSLSSVNSCVATVNSILNTIKNTNQAVACQAAYFAGIAHLANEVTNLTKAGVTFTAGYLQALGGFAKQVPTLGADKDEQYTYEFFANIITDDYYGDTIRASIAERINSELLASVGIVSKNDPAPSSIITQAKLQNIPISTYISQNK